MTTDLSTLSRDQLERLATVLREGVDGSLASIPWDGIWVDTLEGAIKAADAILAEPRNEPHPWTVREALLCITDVLEAHVRFADMKQQGMSVPFHGDFADAMRLPSFVGRVRWWARELRAVLDATRPASAPTDREVVEAWVFGGEQRGAFLSGDAPHISLHDRVADSHFIWVSATGPDEAYAQAAAWVREQGK